jgi:hypothetical protein
MESTAHPNLRLTNEIKREKRVIVDAWNREWKLRHYWLAIVSENKITLDPEIATVIWVAADVWSRQRKRIHDRREKPKAKIYSCLTHRIVKHTMPVLIQKSDRKLSLCKTRNHLWNWFTTDGWNRQHILIHGWQTKSKEKRESSLTHGIGSENCVTTNQKSSAKTKSL